MKTYCFDEVIDRRGSGDVKHAMLNEWFGRSDLAALWVADMDFATPDFIVDALQRRLEHPILGYTTLPEGYWQMVAQWVETHHGWKVAEEWMRFIPGIVKGIGMVVNFFTRPGDRVIIQPPVYHPFRITPEGNGREVVMNPLRRLEDEKGQLHYEMDFDQLGELCDERCRLLILSNPHNPAGICWDRRTLERLAHFCYEHNILVISDEIHCDLALFGNRHIPFATVSDEAAKCSITFQAPSKTFNIAGIVSSYCIIPNEKIRCSFYEWLEANEFDYPHLMAPIATMAAYGQGEEWRRQLLRYLEGNVRLVEDFCATSFPKIRPMRPQASFLMWLDCRAMGLKQEALVDFFVNKARLALNDGVIFGLEGEGFMRLNIGEPRSVLYEALLQLSDVKVE